jgi:hypothetical protein
MFMSSIMTDGTTEGHAAMLELPTVKDLKTVAEGLTP